MKCLIFCICILCSVCAFAGGESGGSTICTNPAVNHGEPILLDLAADKYLIDTPLTGTRLRSDKVADALGYDLVNLHKNRAYKLAQATIEKWEQLLGSRRSMTLVDEGLKSITFAITPFKINRLSRVYLARGSKCQSTDLRTVILFHNGVLNISIPEWNKLGLLSQAGALIHEALRNVQIVQQLGGSDADLERLTVEILLGPDRVFGRDNLDSNPFFAKYFTNTNSWVGQVTEACTQLESLVKKYPRQAQLDAIVKEYPSQSAITSFRSDVAGVCSLSRPTNITEAMNDLDKVMNDDLAQFEQAVSLVPSLSNLNLKRAVWRETDDLAFLIGDELVPEAISKDDYAIRDATTALNGVTDTIPLKMINLFLKGEVKPGTSPAEIAYVQQLIKLTRARYVQFLESVSSP